MCNSNYNLTNEVNDSETSSLKSLGDLGDAALHYAGLGLSVVPLMQNAKKPATRNGIYDASLAPDQIRMWWTKVPTCNVGIATGASDLAVIDVDGRLGEQSLAGLESNLGVLHYGVC